MSEIKFACPTCQQHIQAEQGYAGMEISCPACSGRMVVPGTPIVARISAPVPAPVYAAPPAAPPYAPPPSAPAPAAAGCPSCGAALARGAMLCTKCGYNLATKKRMVGGRVVPPGKAMAPKDSSNLFLTPYPYLGVVVLIFALLFFLGKSNGLFRLAYIAAFFLYLAVLHICVAVAAFRESTTDGILALFFPFRFVFRVSDSVVLKVMYGILVVIVLGIFGFKN